MPNFEQLPPPGPEDMTPEYVRPLPVESFMLSKRQANITLIASRLAYSDKLLPGVEPHEISHLRTSHVDGLVAAFDDIRQAAGNEPLEPAPRDRIALYLYGAPDKFIVKHVPGLQKLVDAKRERIFLADEVARPHATMTMEAADALRERQRTIALDFLQRTRSSSKTLEVQRRYTLPVADILEYFEKSRAISGPEQAALLKHFTDSEHDLSPEEQRLSQRFLALARARRDTMLERARLTKDGTAPSGRELALLNDLLGVPKNGRAPLSRAQIAEATDDRARRDYRISRPTAAQRRTADDRLIAESLSWLFIA